MRLPNNPEDPSSSFLTILNMGINIFHNTWTANCWKPWIWDQHFQQNMKWKFSDLHSKEIENLKSSFSIKGIPLTTWHLFAFVVMIRLINFLDRLINGLVRLLIILSSYLMDFTRLIALSVNCYNSWLLKDIS